MGNCFIYGQSGGGGIKTGDYGHVTSAFASGPTIMTGYSSSAFPYSFNIFDNILICIREGNGVFSNGEGALFKIKANEEATVTTSMGVSVSAYAQQVDNSIYFQFKASQMFNAGSITIIAWD